jgi:hypothetical protein
MPLLIWLWDAFIGFGYGEWDGSINPPFILVAFIWPISIPYMIIDKFGNYLKSVKAKRIKKEESRTKIRIAAEKELEEYLEQIEVDLKKRRL